jgi:hypothetical protein
MRLPEADVHPRYIQAFLELAYLKAKVFLLKYIWISIDGSILNILRRILFAIEITHILSEMIRPPIPCAFMIICL